MEAGPIPPKVVKTPRGGTGGRGGARNTHPTAAWPWAAAGMNGMAAECTCWSWRLSGGILARKARLEVRAWEGGASMAAEGGDVGLVNEVSVGCLRSGVICLLSKV